MKNLFLLYRPSARWLSISALVVILFGSFTGFIPHASALQGEKFAWVDQYTMRVSGGDLKSAANLKSGVPVKANNYAVYGTVTFKEGCSLDFNVVDPVTG